jgi:hypothetical protein
MSLLVLCQQTHAEMISSRSGRVMIGLVLNGDPSRMHSVLHRPMAVFRERVVIGVADGADRGLQPGEHQGPGEMNTPILASRI